MTEDLFEEARKKFFGTDKVTSGPSVSPAPPLKPRNDLSQESQPPSPSSDEREDI